MDDISQKEVNFALSEIKKSTELMHDRYVTTGYPETHITTVKPVCNDHLYNKIYYLRFIW